MPDISQINIPNNDGSMTYNLKDANVPHSSLPAVSGGTDLSLVTTGEKSEWQDKGNYVVRGTNTTSNTFGHWTGNISIPELYNGLIITYICSRNTIDVSSCDLELTFPDGSTSGRIKVLFDDGVAITTEYQRERCLTLTYIDADHTSWGDPGWIVIAPSVLQWYVDDTEDGNYPLLFSEYAGRVTLNTTNCGAYKDTTFWYNPSTHNLHAEKVNGYTLAPACEKQVDTEVEQSSDNLPTSDAVYTAINNIHIQTKTASGAIATFNDASGDVPFATLKSDINPVQDLHGYSKPWSGGGGKNKAQVTATSQTISGVAYTVATDGRVKANGTASGASILDLGTITLIGGTEYTLTGCPSGGSGSTYALFLRGSGSFAQKIDFGGGNQFIVTDTVTTTLSMIVYNGYTASNLNFEPMVRLSNTSADFEPYSNICPISGFSALNVTLADENMQTVDTATVNFGQTVYGGVADVTNGKVTVMQIAHVFDGSENFLTLASGRVFAYDFGVNLVGSYNNNNSLCSHFHTGWGSWDLLGVGEYLVGGGRYGGVNPDMTLADYKTYLQAQYSNGTPVIIVATLATPTEITTTPENLTAIVGQNNVYSDTNGDTEVEYFSGDCDGIIKLLKTLMVI